MSDPARHSPSHFGKALDDLPASLRAVVQSNLKEGEEVLWLDQPIPKAYGQRFNGGLVAGVLLVMFVAFVTYLCAINPEPQPTSGYFFLGVLGLAGVAGCLAPLAGRWMARRTVYGVTDQRVFATSTWGLGLASWSLPWKETGKPVRWRWDDGRGSLVFPDWRPKAISDPDSSRHFGFHAAPDINRVYEIVVGCLKET